MDEIVFSVVGRSFALARFTRDAPGARDVVTYPSFDPKGGRVVAHHILSGPTDTLAGLEKAFRQSYPGATPVGAARGSLAFLVDTTTAELESAASPETFAMRAFTAGTQLGPVLVKEGRVTVRALVPGPLDLKAVQRVQEEGTKAGTWNGFQVLRSGPFDPSLTVDASLAEDLTPKQLEVVRAALALGYYDSPRRITLHTLSEMYGISKAAAHNRLQAAERKIILTYFA